MIIRHDNKYCAQYEILYHEILYHDINMVVYMKLILARGPLIQIYLRSPPNSKPHNFTQPPNPNSKLFQSHNWKAW